LASEPAQVREECFTRDLEAIALKTTGEKVTVAEIEEVLHGRGFASLSLILCIPFVQPIPLPGLSIIFGIALMALGLRLAFGSAGGLPHFIRQRTVDAGTLRKIIHGAARVFSYVERFFKPRLGVMLRPPLLNVVGVSIVVSGLALSLPLPPVILFSNSLPAWAVILLCLGYLERDGLVIVAGHLITIGTWCYFAVWWEAIKLGFQSLSVYLQ
jgi:hypothetical protein